VKCSLGVIVRSNFWRRPPGVKNLGLLPLAKRGEFLPVSMTIVWRNIRCEALLGANMFLFIILIYEERLVDLFAWAIVLVI
jgi:hypothetical protein